MLKKMSRGKDGDNVKKILEEQARDIMRSSELKELDQAEIPKELRDRLEGADVAAMDDLEEELGFNEEEVSQKPPEEEPREEIVSQVTDKAANKANKQVEQLQHGIDASCIVKINDDKMSALISLYPSQQGGKPLDFSLVKKELEAAGVVYGINEDLLKKLISTAEKTHEEKEGVIIAKGLPPEDGKDGLIVYHFGEDEAILDQRDEEEEKK